MRRNAERFQNSAARNLRGALIAVCESVRSENIRRTCRFYIAAELRAACVSAFRIEITAERSDGRSDVRHDISVTDSVDQMRVKVCRRKPCAI